MPCQSPLIQVARLCPCVPSLCQTRITKTGHGWSQLASWDLRNCGIPIHRNRMEEFPALTLLDPGTSLRKHPDLQPRAPALILRRIPLPLHPLVRWQDTRCTRMRLPHREVLGRLLLRCTLFCTNISKNALCHQQQPYGRIENLWLELESASFQLLEESVKMELVRMHQQSMGRMCMIQVVRFLLSLSSWPAELNSCRTLAPDQGRRLVVWLPM